MAEKKRREQDEKDRIEQAAKESALARQDYEKAEALRLVKLKEEQDRQA